VILDHKIALDPTPQQAAHCRRACGTARYARSVRAQQARSHEVTKCASGQAIMDLGTACATPSC
jgi:hypothetical protein